MIEQTPSSEDSLPLTPERVAAIQAAATKEAGIAALTQQILSQGTSGQWKGEGFGSAQKNAEDMARILDSIGITDINQFGQVQTPVYETYQLQQNANGDLGYYAGGGGDNEAVWVPATAAMVAAMDNNGVAKVQTGTQTTYGNKVTGQAVPNTYSERQTGNAWGGTFEGSGNTGYRVQFNADGTPVFYTTAASSNTLANIMQDLGPAGQIAMAIATGGLSIPQQIAANMALQVLSGKDLEDAIKSAAINLAVANIPTLDVMKDATKFIKDLGLSETMTNAITNATQNAATSAAKAVLTGQNLADAVLRGAATGGVNGATSTLLRNVDGFKDLTDAQKRLVSNAVTGVISGKPLDQVLINAAIATANAEIKNAKADAEKYAPLSEDDLAELNAGEKQAYDEGGTKGLVEFRQAMKNLTSLTDSGRTGDDMGGDTLPDILTGDTGDDTTTGGDSTDTVTVTGTGEDATTGGTGTDTATGGDSTDTVTVTGTRDAHGCDPATEYWDPVTDKCELKQITPDTTPGGDSTDTVTVTGTRDAHGCDPATEYWDPVTDKCELKQITPDTTPGGDGSDTVVVTDTHDCGDDKYWDPVTGQCEPKQIDTEKPALTCPEGSEPNDAGTECVPVVTIVDKKCDPGFVYDEDLKSCVPRNCGAGMHWDAVTNGCVEDSCLPGYVMNDAGTECIPEMVIEECAPGKVRDANGDCVPVVDKGCDPGFTYDEDLKTCVPEMVIEECAPGKVRDANGDCVPVVDKGCDPGFTYDEDLKTCVPEMVIEECAPGKVRDANGDCVPVVDKGCDPGFTYDEDLKTCVPEMVIEECAPGKVRDANGDCVPVVDKGCAPGKVRDANGDCVPVVDKGCAPGLTYDEDLKTCVPEMVIEECAPGKVRDANGDCVPIDCGAGKHWDPITQQCEPNTVIDHFCPTGQHWDDAQNKCVDNTVDHSCPAGQHWDAAQNKCVADTTPPPPPPTPCPTGQHWDAAKNKCVADTTTTTPTTVPTGIATSTETTTPIYAKGMGDFDLFATLEELLSSNNSKNTTQDTQQNTKMATGGYLDDLLAEQMTVDDLLKLLR